MNYRFCGNSGLQLPLISLGLWHNFGDVDDFSTATAMILHAFEQGITHFDLANNYGPPPGSAESNFGKILQTHLKAHRDELIISSKAGHLMWDGPYGDGGSRKYILASIDQSLKRTGLEYFDIFYSHRYDAQTPLEETIQALIDIVKQGKALYAGLSKYPEDKARQAYDMMEAQQVRCLIYQDKYNLLSRNPESGL
ncbi:MAG: aldo/keto reductase, partial [Candidatus Symbiothrix sp.]|nr:aldo/keto reductase [Candidatus Symbiothrix sp.]